MATETGGRMLTRDGKRSVDVPLEHTAVRIRVDGHLVDANARDRPQRRLRLDAVPPPPLDPTKRLG